MNMLTSPVFVIQLADLIGLDNEVFLQLVGWNWVLKKLSFEPSAMIYYLKMKNIFQCQN